MLRVGLQIKQQQWRARAERQYCAASEYPRIPCIQKEHQKNRHEEYRLVRERPDEHERDADHNKSGLQTLVQHIEPHPRERTGDARAVERDNYAHTDRHHLRERDDIDVPSNKRADHDDDKKRFERGYPPCNPYNAHTSVLYYLCRCCIPCVHQENGANAFFFSSSSCSAAPP